MAATLAAGLAGMQERLQPTAPLQGNGYHQARDLPSTFSTAHHQMAHSVHAPRLLGARFVQAYLAVKALEHLEAAFFVASGVNRPGFFGSYTRLVLT